MGLKPINQYDLNIGDCQVFLDDFTYFYPEKPALISVNQGLFHELSNDPNYFAEPKYNGTRLQLHRLTSGDWLFYGRHGELLAYQPSTEVVKALNQLPLKGYWLFDGELRHGKTAGVMHRIILFDVFVASGFLLLGIPFKERRGTLEIIFHYADLDSGYHLDMAPQYESNFDTLFNNLTTEDEIEGLVIKDQRGILNLGRTSAQDSTWLFKVRKPTGRWRF